MSGQEMLTFAKELYPLNRSITGEGLRQTLRRIQVELPELQIRSVPTGTQVFDWIVPDEWEISDAFIEDPSGRRIVDFSNNNLHVVGYSVAVDVRMSLDELNLHLHSLPDLPDAIPYVTSYYHDNWGFCLSHRQRQSLPSGNYRVVIRSRKFDGVLNYGELFIPGRSAEEVLLSSYVCHPSLANNELSGPTVLTFLGKQLSARENRLSYRLVFVPETIGAICFLNDNLEHLRVSVSAGFNLTCIGDERNFSVIHSRLGTTLSDRVAVAAARMMSPSFREYTFLDRGSDERQYCSPLVDMPIVTLCRTRFYDFPEYHTSLDNFDVVTAQGLEGGFQFASKCIELLENNPRFRARFPCEPQLGRRGLYPSLGGAPSGASVNFLLDVLAYCDGHHDAQAISQITRRPVEDVTRALDVLLSYEFIRQ
jgi:aminopeptidase-like protein